MMKKFFCFLFLFFLFFVSQSHAADTTMRIDLGWDANIESDLAGYSLYYKEVAGGPPYDGIGALEGSSPINIEDPSKTTFSVTLPKSQRWFFTITAYDKSELESDYSNEVSGYYYSLDPAKTDCSPEGVINYDDGTIVITSSSLTPPVDPKSIFWKKGGLGVNKAQEITVSFSASAYGAVGEVPISLLLVDGDGVPISKERVALLTEEGELHEIILVADETAANIALFVYCGLVSAIYDFSKIEVTAGEEGKAVIHLRLRSLEP